MHVVVVSDARIKILGQEPPKLSTVVSTAHSNDAMAPLSLLGEWSFVCAPDAHEMDLRVPRRESYIVA
jgi:hypothetical protein